MEIRCKKCGAAYDCAKELSCPNCGTENAPFRSSAARQALGTAGLPDHGWSEHLASRQERLSHEKKPSFFRNLMPYLQIILVVFAVGMVGTILTNWAKNPPNAPPAPPDTDGNKPPILTLATAAFNAQFNPADGIQLTVDCTGRVDKGQLGGYLKPGEQCIFVDIVATVDNREEMNKYFTPPYLIADGETVRPVDLRGVMDLSSYTPFDYELLKREIRVSGQLFYILPEETNAFSMRASGGPGVEQETKLHL